MAPCSLTSITNQSFVNFSGARDVILANNELNDRQRGMLESTMPPLNHSDGGTKGTLIELGRKGLQWIHTTLASASKQNSPRFPILDKKERWMKFPKGVIIGCKFMNGNEILVSLRHMKNIFRTMSRS
jgi:hypothetical protein